MEVVNKDVPLKKLSNKEIKRKKKPWVTKGIITSIHKRNSHSGHPPPLSAGGGVEPPTKFSKKRGALQELNF